MKTKSSDELGKKHLEVQGLVIFNHSSHDSPAAIRGT